MRCGPKGLAMSGGAFSPDNFFKIWTRPSVIRRIQEPTVTSFFLTVSIHFRVWWSSECDGAFRSGNKTAGRTFYSFRLLLACVASVSVRLVLPARKMVREPKRGKRRRGRGREEVSIRSPPPPPPFFWLSPHFSRCKNTENPVPRSFFAPKPHGKACYAG